MKVLKAAAVVGSAFAFGLSALTPFSASADDLITLQPAIWKGMLGDTLQGQMLKSDLSYQSVTFTYQDYFEINPYDQNFDVDFLYGNIVLRYSAPVPPGWTGIYSVDIPVTFPYITTLDFSVLGWVDLTTIANNSIQDFRQYCFGSYSYGGVQTTVYPQTNAAGTKGGCFRLGSSNSWRTAGVSCLRFGLYDFSGTVNLLEVSENYGYTENGQTNIFITLPLVNSDYEDEPYPDPGPDIPAYVTVDGEASGSISENSSGGYDINYNYNIQVPDYNGVLNPSLNGDQSSRMSGARDTVDEYHTAEQGLLSEADDGLSSLPDLEFDESLIEDAENPFSEFFGINIVGIMVFWVGAIAFISYVLFGKWV